jgi:hypothetical protein
MRRRLQIAVLLVGVVLLGLDAQALACELSCAAETHQSQHESQHSHHHSGAVSESADPLPHLHTAHLANDDDHIIVVDQRPSHPLPGCAAADRVTLSVSVIAQPSVLSHSVTALVEDNVRANRLAHQSPAEFDSPPYICSAPKHNFSPLRI